MKQSLPLHSSYAALFDPAVALAAAKRAAQWDLPRHICHPLDRYAGRRVNADLDAFDAAIDLAPAGDEALDEEPLSASIGNGHSASVDFDDEDEL